MSTDFTNVDCTSDLYPLLTSRLALPSLTKFLSLIPSLLFYIEMLMASIIQGTHGTGSRVQLVGVKVMVYRLTLRMKSSIRQLKLDLKKNRIRAVLKKVI